MTKRLLILVGTAILLTTLVIVFSSDVGTAKLWSFSREGNWLLPLVMIAAVIDSINPCAFSILLLTIAFLFSVGKLRNNILKIGGVYIFGIFLVYIFIGLGILQTLHLFNTPNFMGKLGAILMIALGGINIVNDLFPSFPIKLKIPSISHHRMALLMEKASVPAAFLLGVFVGLCEFPCTGGPYLMVLGLLHDKMTYWTGVAYLLLYNIIFVSPLVIILLIAGDSTVVQKIQKWKSKKMHRGRLISGIIMIAIGLIIFFI